jgi:hypothetical protein
MSLCALRPPAKRVRTVDAAGAEEPHEHNKWIHLDLKEVAAQADAAGAEGAAHQEQGAGAPEEAPDRMKPFESLYAARVRVSPCPRPSPPPAAGPCKQHLSTPPPLCPSQAELDVIVDLINNVQGGQLMALQHITRPTMSADAKFADMAASNMARLAARQVRALATAWFRHP